MVLGLLRKLIGAKKVPMIMGSPAANALVRAQLAEHGDDGRSERHVLHFAYPRDSIKSASLYEVVDFLSDFPLVVSETQFQGGIQAEQEREIASEGFDEFTSRLFDELDAMGWRYDGWECAVVKG